MKAEQWDSLSNAERCERLPLMDVPVEEQTAWAMKYKQLSAETQKAIQEVK